MKFNWIAILFFTFGSGVLSVSSADAELIPSADGLTVYDTVLQVRWLANANLAKKAAAARGVDNVDPNGAMDFKTALQWVEALNGMNGDAPYLGHTNWTLPTSPTYPATDPSCNATGPEGNSFGFHCMNSAMGSLYYQSLGLQYPDTAVPIPYDNRIGPFSNFQPYLYWSHTSSGNNANGYHTFSFNTGWEGSNVDGHYMYVLPMIKGKISGITYHDYAPGINTLQVSDDDGGQTVYDPDAVYYNPDGTKHTGVTWLANADLAITQWFGAQCVNTDGTQCINPDGSMTHTTAKNWIDGMNAYNGVGWLDQTNWQLPPTNTSDSAEADCIPGFGCDGSPMGELFYDQLHLTQGTPVAQTPDINVGPFNNLQPYLYWSCGAIDTLAACQVPAATGFEWSFSFGNGFQGTDVVGNNFYVMVYYPETPEEALMNAIMSALGTNPELNAFLSQAAGIISAPNDHAKAGKLRAFINHVNAKRNKVLTAAEADELIALAQVV
jgi:hypothetical protein